MPCNLKLSTNIKRTKSGTLDLRDFNDFSALVTFASSIVSNNGYKHILSRNLQGLETLIGSVVSKNG